MFSLKGLGHNVRPDPPPLAPEATPPPAEPEVPPVNAPVTLIEQEAFELAGRFRELFERFCRETHFWIAMYQITGVGYKVLVGRNNTETVLIDMTTRTRHFQYKISWRLEQSIPSDKHSEDLVRVLSSDLETVEAFFTELLPRLR